jgi:hypothetical protein
VKRDSGGLHAKPCGMLNVLGHYTPLLAKTGNRALVLARDPVVELLQALEEWRPVRVEKWLDRETR